MGLGKDKVERRRNAILSLLNSSDAVAIAAFCEELGCSESTVRNDLALMERQGLLRRTFGGAVKTEETPYNLIRLTSREAIYHDEKKRIAEYVVRNIIEPNTTVLLDAGSTTAEIAKKITEYKIPLTILTPSLLAASSLVASERVKLYMFGGFYNDDQGSFFDEYTRTCIESMRADLFLMGINGISADAGVSITTQTEITMKTIFMNISTRTVAVGDHSKIGRNLLRVIAGFDEVPLFVTDSEAEPEQVQRLREKGLEVVLAE